ncbi:PspC domain-containing protein [Isoptericola sp. b441]|uniref:PspC domain-containing protein n=1 Tax=Actinotalea lenta TaxID=3064654 RepID=A0ABT9D4P4_9CELL|nr:MULTISPECIES: ATP-binding protein [unclassified Isoptericola]MDO8105631.1 PspC domain-containing protein [Isoptericola sp. b441]MDO8122335.1 PspC domain-containing protein [Isoptericola sp. b490]
METRARLPLRRPERGRVLGGVAAGLAAHLGLPVATVRVALVLLVALGGAGVVLYVFWWVTVPSGDPLAAAEELRPAASVRLAPRLREPGRRLPVAEIALGVLLLTAAGVLVAIRNGVDVGGSWVLPALILLGGTALGWSQLDGVHREPGTWGGGTPVSVLRLLGGTALATSGVFLLVGREAPMEDLVRSGLAALAVLMGAALVLAPWWLRLVRELSDERLARARASERADIAAHLHDSVLQTLALIRSRASDSEEVARLARAQERELRTWLYDDRVTPGTSVAADLRAVVAEVEDQHGVPVEVVVVGDRVPCERTAGLLRATREALTNAVRHGRPPVSVYLEIGPDTVEVFVKDRGDGFDPDAVPEDRFGVRESIVGRMRRLGGSARVRSRSEGTEVALRLPVEAQEGSGR